MVGQRDSEVNETKEPPKTPSDRSFLAANGFYPSFIERAAHIRTVCEAWTGARVKFHRFLGKRFNARWNKS